MGRCYSMDLRERVTAFVAQGHSRRAAARRLGVSESFAIKLVKHQERSGSPAPVRQGRPHGSGKLAPSEAVLIQEVEKKPDITMPDLGFWRSTGLQPPRPASRVCSAGSASPIKKAQMAAECARADIRDERRVWTGQRQARMREQPHRLVFVDETFINTKMTRLRGRSRKGERLRASAPFGHWNSLWPLENAHLHRRAALS